MINYPDFTSYEKEALATAQYPELGKNLIYPALGLVGEAGEVAEKVKKLWRNKNQTYYENNYEIQQQLVSELGDVLWYITAMAFELKVNLQAIAEFNIAKLQSRNKRGVIKSEGDNR